nr:TPA_exp: cytochrome P450 enzyme 43 [Aphis glycines]
MPIDHDSLVVNGRSLTDRVPGHRIFKDKASAEGARHTEFHADTLLRDAGAFGLEKAHQHEHQGDVQFQQGGQSIIIHDVELAKSVLVRRFDHFSHRRGFVEGDVDPMFGKNLANANGDRWRELRNLLSPAFTSSRMRAMLVLMSNCAENFVDQLLDRRSDAEPVELKDALTRYATDVIATCAYGIEVDSVKNPDNEFYKFGRRSSKIGFATMLKFLALLLFPRLSRLAGFRIVSKRDTDFIVGVVESTVKTRKERNIFRPDMLQLMIEAQDKMDNLSIEEMAAQAFVFFLAGFETTASHMCLMAHELAMHPHVQLRLQEEIDEAMGKCNGQLTYDAVNGMLLLDAVFNETLRLHPIGYLSRICSEEFELPPALPGSKPYALKRGVEVMIPVAGINSDPRYFDEPGKFDPARFVDDKTPGVFNLGFGLGPRMCIGNRFAILEAKVLFVHLLQRASLRPCAKTRLPLRYDPRSFTPTPEGGCWLDLKRRTRRNS